jgi:hypothetical protein
MNRYAVLVEIAHEPMPYLVEQIIVHVNNNGLIMSQGESITKAEIKSPDKYSFLLISNFDEDRILHIFEDALIDRGIDYHDISVTQR